MNQEGPILPGELDDFLRRHGIRWMAASEITAQDWDGNKRAFQLTLTDGTLVKARLLLPGQSAHAILRSLRTGGAARRCAKVLLGEGRCLLEEWVPGTPLNHLTPALDVLEECGRALADIHRTALAAEDITASPSWDGLDRLRHDLGILCERASLNDEERRALLDIAASSAPSTSLCGLVHLDYQGSNLVIHSQRGPICIDNESVRSGPFAFDIARTLLLWPLEMEAEQSFLAGYASAGGPAELHHTAFWSLAAEALSARIRAEHGNPAASHPLAKLRRRIHG